MTSFHIRTECLCFVPFLADKTDSSFHVWQLSVITQSRSNLASGFICCLFQEYNGRLGERKRVLMSNCFSSGMIQHIWGIFPFESYSILSFSIKHVIFWTETAPLHQTIQTTPPQHIEKNESHALAWAPTQDEKHCDFRLVRYSLCSLLLLSLTFWAIFNYSSYLNIF
jgi:hypothetical protein